MNIYVHNVKRKTEVVERRAVNRHERRTEVVERRAVNRHERRYIFAINTSQPALKRGSMPMPYGGGSRASVATSSLNHSGPVGVLGGGGW